MSAKNIAVTLGLLMPLVAYLAATFWYAYGGYDGERCAGLLDAVWECTKFEYYLAWLVNPFTLIALFFFYLVSAVATPVAWWLYKKYN